MSFPVALLCACFLLLMGGTATAALWPSNPKTALPEVLLLYLVGVVPLWFSLVLWKYILFHRQQGRVHFPRQSKPFLCLNLLVLAPMLLGVGWFYLHVMSSSGIASSGPAALILLIPLVLMWGLLRRIFATGMKEMTSNSKESLPDAGKQSPPSE